MVNENEDFVVTWTNNRLFHLNIHFFTNSLDGNSREEHCKKFFNMLKLVLVQPHAHFYLSSLEFCGRNLSFGCDLAEWSERQTAHAVVATVLGSIPTSSDHLERTSKEILECAQPRFGPAAHTLSFGPSWVLRPKCKLWMGWDLA